MNEYTKPRRFLVPRLKVRNTMIRFARERKAGKHQMTERKAQRNERIRNGNDREV